MFKIIKSYSVILGIEFAMHFWIWLQYAFYIQEWDWCAIMLFVCGSHHVSEQVLILSTVNSQIFIASLLYRARVLPMSPEHGQVQAAVKEKLWSVSVEMLVWETGCVTLFCFADFLHTTQVKSHYDRLLILTCWQTAYHHSRLLSLCLTSSFSFSPPFLLYPQVGDSVLQ